MSATGNSFPVVLGILHMDSFFLLFQRINLEHFFSIDRKLPVCVQFFAADFYPGQYETSLALWKFPCDEFAICNAEDSLIVPIFCVNVRDVMLFVVCIVHADDNAIKHG